jgi:hypothetical protein
VPVTIVTIPTISQNASPASTPISQWFFMPVSRSTVELSRIVQASGAKGKKKRRPLTLTGGG